MDISQEITNVVQRLAESDELFGKFKNDAQAAIRSIVGANVDDNTVGKIVFGVKSLLRNEKLADGLETVKGLFADK